MTTTSKKVKSKAEITQTSQYSGIPNMPDDYWKAIGRIRPPFKMGKPERPKTWVVGLNGPRGGGKSVSGAWLTASQYLLRGIPIYTIPEEYWIKVPLMWNGRVYVFQSEPLDIDKLFIFDDSLYGTCVLADEANLQLADSHRAMSNKNLYITDYAQQCRHHGVSMIYTVISANWIDPRLRELTDVMIYCTDPSAFADDEDDVEEGEWCNWNLTDHSGLLTGVPFEVDPQYYPWQIPLKDYWNITDSFMRADISKARMNVSFTNARYQIDIGNHPDKALAEIFGQQIEDFLMREARSRQPDKNGRIWISREEIRDGVGVEDADIRQKTLVGRMINSYGFKESTNVSGYPRGRGVVDISKLISG